MDLLDGALAGLALAALALAGLAASLWSRLGRTRALLRQYEAEVTALRRHDASMRDAFDVYRRSHVALIDAVRPRGLTDAQRRGLRLHLADLAGINVQVRIAADCEPGNYAKDLCLALNAAGARAELDPAAGPAIAEKDAEGTIQVAATPRARLLRAALKTFAFPLADREFAVARVRRGDGETEGPEVIVTLGSRRVPPELMDLPPPPKPPPVPPVALPPGRTGLPVPGSGATME